MADRYSKMGASDFEITYGYSIRYIANRNAAILIEFNASNNSNNATKLFCLKNVLKAIDIALEKYDACVLPITSFEVIRNVIDNSKFSICVLIEFKAQEHIEQYKVKLRQCGVII